ncbi:glycoside hydrolase family 88 protein [Tamlana fucoidanivorans]|uniref:Glycosyl hydrolase n=1 Tax=Allotamlana fucoidanivorans TaxID=2583814 RepID=A0A5C4SJ55_9FLAO|nr:glycoside hydrolase family 88 protein [Tamlana fucoidanivorans]TNJ43802.1 glycosyl hydrolase [Tamlana fucoidanivorans]
MKSLFTITSLLCLSLILSCTSEQAEEIPSADEVKKLTEKVANWQIETFADMGTYRALPSKEHRKKWHNRKPYHDLEWTNGALYAGMFQLSEISHYPKYINWLVEIGDKNKWQLHKRMYHADDHTVGQFYLSLHQNVRLKHIAKITPTKNRFDSIMNSEQGKAYQWDWCDALFMAPPVWARLAKITKDSTYLNYMDTQYKMTYNELWDENEKLFFRDKSYFNQKEKNGNKIFWSRGNGWVFGGLALMIPDLPKDWKERAFYTDLFKQMAQTIKATQRADGTWSAGLLGDVKDYPNIETSGSAFFTFGIAWGINNGLLEREVYEPVLLKAWKTISGAVNEAGMLGYVQPVGAAPGESFKDYTEVYGIGAFLAAGSEMYKFINKFYPISKVTTYKTFMEDGGWCWYQDPRVIISEGKLLIGGLSGQSGDVRLGVYDLTKEQTDSTLVLHKNLQRDDHNVPALYQRPDKSVLAIWAKHASEKIHYYSTSEGTNYLKWGATKQYIHEYDSKRGVTYMNLYEMKPEGKLYNFFRDGLNFNPSFITSEDYGETWGNRTHFISNDVAGFQRPYARYLQIDDNTIGVSYTDAHPRAYGNNLYYVEFSDNTFYNVDDSKIKSLNEGPLRSTEAERIFQGSDTKDKPIINESVPNSAWTCAMAKDKNNNPHLGYTLYKADNDLRFRLASWDGETWGDREIAYAGKCLYKVESSYSGLLAFDPEDPTSVYISTDVNPSTGEDLGGNHEIYHATINAKDDISTITWEALTKNSPYRNIRPIVVAKDGYKVLLWLYGPWYNFLDYDVNVIGKILEKPE